MANPPIQPQQQFAGVYLETTQVWDVSEIQKLDVPPAVKEVLVRLYLNQNRVNLSLSQKQNGYFNTSQFVTGKTYFPNPNINPADGSAPSIYAVFRSELGLVILFTTTLVAATMYTIPHGITCTTTTTFTNYWALANDTTNQVYVKIPYAGVTYGNIEMYVDNTNVYINTGATIPSAALSTTYIVLEYLQT